MSRISPVDPPFEAATAEVLAAMMPPGQPPLNLFRTFARHLPMAEAMRRWGGHELGPTLALSRRDREIVIDRTCARCGCEYEWAVHTWYFAGRVGLTPQQVTSLAHGDQEDPCWLVERERLLIAAADCLHDTSTIDDQLWPRLAEAFTDQELLDLFLLCGWYHAVSFAANAAGVALEPHAPRLDDVR